MISIFRFLTILGILGIVSACKPQNSSATKAILQGSHAYAILPVTSRKDPKAGSYYSLLRCSGPEAKTHMNILESMTDLDYSAIRVEGQKLFDNQGASMVDPDFPVSRSCELYKPEAATLALKMVMSLSNPKLLAPHVNQILWLAIRGPFDEKKNLKASLFHMLDEEVGIEFRVDETERAKLIAEMDLRYNPCAPGHKTIEASRFDASACPDYKLTTDNVEELVAAVTMVDKLDESAFNASQILQHFGVMVTGNYRLSLAAINEIAAASSSPGFGLASGSKVTERVWQSRVSSDDFRFVNQSSTASPTSPNDLQRAIKERMADQRTEFAALDSQIIADQIAEKNRNEAINARIDASIAGEAEDRERERRARVQAALEDARLQRAANSFAEAHHRRGSDQPNDLQISQGSSGVVTVIPISTQDPKVIHNPPRVAGKAPVRTMTPEQIARLRTSHAKSPTRPSIDEPPGVNCPKGYAWDLNKKKCVPSPDDWSTPSNPQRSISTWLGPRSLYYHIVGLMNFGDELTDNDAWK